MATRFSTDFLKLAHPDDKVAATRPMIRYPQRMIALDQLSIEQMLETACARKLTNCHSLATLMGRPLRLLIGCLRRRHTALRLGSGPDSVRGPCAHPRHDLKREYVSTISAIAACKKLGDMSAMDVKHLSTWFGRDMQRANGQTSCVSLSHKTTSEDFIGPSTTWTWTGRYGCEFDGTPAGRPAGRREPAEGYLALDSYTSTSQVSGRIPPCNTIGAGLVKPAASSR